MSLPEVNAPEVPESLTGRAGRPSGDFSMPKDLSKMNSEERQEWLRGDGESKSWSESSLSHFEVPDAPVDEPKADEVEKSVSGDVTRVSKADREAADHESTESEPSTESERRERHTKNFNDLPVRLAREFSGEYEEMHKAGGQIPVSREVGEFVQHVLADSQSPAKIYKHLCKNPQLVRAFHGMSGQSILGIMEDLDQKLSAPEKKITKAPPPAREVGGRGSSSGNDEDRAIGQGQFRPYLKAANAKDVARAKSR